MPVYILKRDMPYTELLGWAEFLKRRPPGYKEDMRTFMLLSSQGFKGSPEDIFPTIRAVKQHAESKQVDNRAIPKGVILENMLRASKGDGSNIDWLLEAKNEDKSESS